MRAGDYRLPVVLQRPVEIRAASGEATRSFETAGAAFAALRLKNQTERFQDEHLSSVKVWDIRLRPFSGLSGGWRILVGSRVFQVLSVADASARGRELQCEVEEEGP